MDSSKLPVTRGALERVLARAAELQAAAGDDADTARENLTEGQLVELGREVGLSPAHIRQALAEERAKIAPAPSATGSGLAYQLFGANRVAVQRVLQGNPARLLETLDRWMQRDELLRLVRQRPDVHVWEPTRGLVGSLRRAFGSGDFALFRANSISATVVPVEEGKVLVRLDADFSDLRGSMAKQTAIGAAGGTAATAAAIAINVMIPVAIVPAIGITALSYIGSRRRQQYAVQRALLTFEQLLDRLERGDAETPSLLRIIESALPK
jgi:hypothetical protein